MKTSELTGAQLDWAVAKCEHPTIHGAHFNNLRSLHVLHREFYYSSDWSQGGPIIEREKISVWARVDEFAAEPFNDGQEGLVIAGPTPLIAAMRCFVASKLGDEVEIPKELT